MNRALRYCTGYTEVGKLWRKRRSAPAESSRSACCNLWRKAVSLGVHLLHDAGRKARRLFMSLHAWYRRPQSTRKKIGSSSACQRPGQHVVWIACLSVILLKSPAEGRRTIKGLMGDNTPSCGLLLSYIISRARVLVQELRYGSATYFRRGEP